MPRKTNKFSIDNGFGELIQVKQKNYLGNETLPTSDSEFQWTPQMVQSLMRCKEDIVYFAENFFTIIADGVRQHIPLREYQTNALTQMKENKRIIMNCSRQVGKTTLMTIYALWLANFYRDQKVIICGNKISTAMEIFDRIRTAYQDMPNWLKEPIIDFSKKSMTLNNGSKIETGATTESAIRGKTVSCLILDEFAFVDAGVANAFWSAVVPTMVTNKNARLFVSSTPNGTGNLFYELWTQAIQRKSDYVPLQVKWDAVPGRDNEWKESYIKNELHGDRLLFEQEFEGKFVGATNSPFPPQAFEYLESCCKEPLNVLQNGNLSIWKYPENNRVYAIGVDVGDGIGKDYSVINVFDFTDLDSIEQVACWYANDVDTTTFGENVFEIGNMYGCPVMAVERNGVGTGVCQHLFYDRNYPRLLTHGASASAKNFRPGVTSSQNTKSPAVVNMKYWMIDNQKVLIRDKRFVDELRDFERKPNGGWGAKNGEGYHDDYIMSVVWCLYTLHRDVIQKCFIVQEKNVSGHPVKVQNKFRYQIKTGKENVLYKFTDYRGVPVMAFGHDNGYTVSPARPDGMGVNTLLDRGWQHLDDHFAAQRQHGGWSARPLY